MSSAAEQPVIPDEAWNWDTKLGDLEPDCLERGKYAQFLTGYLAGFTDQSYVMNLNAEWGAGKTYFLRRWQETIKDTYPTAYIDAWKHDFDNEPLLTVISGITKTLEDACPNVGVSQNQEAVFKAGKYLLNAAIDGATVSAGGFKFNLGKIKASFSRQKVENELKARLKLHDKKIGKIEEFKEKLEEWLKEVVSYGKLKTPMFVFIDELDRCRPTYAIEMLEVIKHLFDIKGLVFIVGTNTDQLQHSIKAVYGQDFDSYTYLRRFFARTYSLQTPDLKSFIQTYPTFINHISKNILNTCDGVIVVRGVDELAESLAAIAVGLNFDLRTTGQWLDQIHACYPENSKNLQSTIWLYTSILLGMNFNKDFKRLSSILDGSNQLEIAERDNVIKKFLINPCSQKIKLDCYANFYQDKYYNQYGYFKLYENEAFNIDLELTEIYTELLSFFDIKNNTSVYAYMDESPKYSSEVVELLSTIAKGQKNALNLAHYYTEYKYKTTKEHYLNLVKFASDLR